MRRSSILFALALACGSPAEPRAPGAEAPRVSPRPPAKSGVPALEASEVALVPQGTFGPYVGKEGERAMLVWAAEETPGVRSWFARAVSAGGSLGEPQKFGRAPAELGVVAVRGVGQGAFAVVSSRRGAVNEIIEAALLGSDGRALGPVTRVSEASGPVLWVDAAPVGGGRLLLFGVRTNGGAELSAVTLGAKGEVGGEVQTLARNVRAWQVAVFGDSLALAVVREGAEAGTSSALDVLWFGRDGKPLRPPTRLAAESTLELDVDLCVVGDRLVAVWSDRRSGEGRLMAAALAADGSVGVPAGPFTAPLGEQALLRVVAAGETGYAVWENLSAAGSSGRAFEIAPFGREARAREARLRTLYAALDGSLPEVAATQKGVALLTLSPACKASGECDEEEALPAFLELGQALEVVAYEPLRLEPLGGKVTDLAWGLSCLPNGCFALTAENRSPARVYLTELERRSGAFQPPLEDPAREPLPRAIESQIVAQTDALAALAFETSSSGSLLAWLTDFDPTTPWVRLKKPAADGRFDPERSTLAYAPVAPDTWSVGQENTLSRRAHSLGGIALVPGQRERREHVLGWAGVDAGQPQVFLTLLGPEGKKLEQRMLTRKRGGVSDVAAGFVGDGYVVGWVDERSGTPEIYAAKVDLRLNRTGPEQRLTRAPKVPSELVIGTLGTSPVLVFADASESAAPGRADLRALRLSAKDASALGAEARLVETPAHSFAPVLCARADELVVAWLERADDGQGGHAAMLGALDERGAFRRPPERIGLGAGAPGGLALDCGSEYERLAILREGAGAVEVVVLERRAGKLGQPRAVARLPEGSRADQRPVLRGADLLFEENAAGARHRIRRIKLKWD